VCGVVVEMFVEKKEKDCGRGKKERERVRESGSVNCKSMRMNFEKLKS